MTPPEEEHLIVALARSVAKPGGTAGPKTGANAGPKTGANAGANAGAKTESEKYVFDQYAVSMLEYALLQHADDPTLPSAVLGLFNLAGALFEEENSPSAARAILELLAKLRPELRALKPDQSARLEDAARAFTKLLDERRTLDLNAPPREGAVKAVKLEGFNAAWRLRG